MLYKFKIIMNTKKVHWTFFQNLEKSSMYPEPPGTLNLGTFGTCALKICWDSNFSPMFGPKTISFQRTWSLQVHWKFFGISKKFQRTFLVFRPHSNVPRASRYIDFGPHTCHGASEIQCVEHKYIGLKLCWVKSASDLLSSCPKVHRKWVVNTDTKSALEMLGGRPKVHRKCWVGTQKCIGIRNNTSKFI